ncbi:MAG: thiamine pyrophosphate-dependent enzyme [Armatimonadetes bacterium]|nr:thiamine pyrophosphate-dependent enzyme [Armatimonadota bacterium]
MEAKLLTGEEALALGALKAGVKFVVGYPGTPSKGVFKALQNFAETSSIANEIHFHWSTNEKVALELALGATLVGVPSLVCVKSVGTNVMLDALMTVNLTGVPSPLVIALGDDPSAWVSQNEQDSRWLVLMSELPLFEPTQVETAPKLMHFAFQVSASFQLPVIVRFTRSFALSQGKVSEPTLPPVSFEPSKPLPSIASGGNAVSLHSELQEKMRRLEQTINTSRFNQVEGDATFAILAVGCSAIKVRETVRLLSERNQRLDVTLIELATANPLPRRWLIENLSGKSVVLVVEEGAPIVELLVKAIVKEAMLPTVVKGKLTGELPSVGELTLRQIARALRNFVSVSPDAIDGLPDPQRPQGFSLKFCDGCPYPPFFDALKQAAEQLGVELIVAADPGCAIVAIGEPYNLVQIKHSMGGSVNFIASLAKFESSPNRRYIALVGDSDFFHSAFIGIVNAVSWKVPMGLVVLDNGSSAFTGGQPHAGSGFNALGEFVQPVQIERLLVALDIPVQIVSSRDAENLAKATRWLLDYGSEIRALILREPCPFVPVWTSEGLKPQKTDGKIVGE